MLAGWLAGLDLRMGWSWVAGSRVWQVRTMLCDEQSCVQPRMLVDDDGCDYVDARA